MAKWRQAIDFSDVWDTAKTGMPLKEVAGIVAKRLTEQVLPHYQQSLPTYTADDWLATIVDSFTELSEEPEVEVEAFGHELKNLYDWADTEHRLWIKTS